MANDAKNVRLALAKALASHRVEDAVIDKAARHLATLPQQIRGINICQYGICLDLFLDGKEWRKSLNELLEVDGHVWENVNVLIHGIPFPDLAHVRVGELIEGLPRGVR